VIFLDKALFSKFLSCRKGYTPVKGKLFYKAIPFSFFYPERLNSTELYNINKMEYYLAVFWKL